MPFVEGSGYNGDTVTIEGICEPVPCVTCLPANPFKIEICGSNEYIHWNRRVAFECISCKLAALFTVLLRENPHITLPQWKDSCFCCLASSSMQSKALSQTPNRQPSAALTLILEIENINMCPHENVCFFQFDHNSTFLNSMKTSTNNKRRNSFGTIWIWHYIFHFAV